MDLKDVYAVIGYVVGAGGLAVLVREVFSYWSGKRKADYSHEIAIDKLEDSRMQAIFDRLTGRIKDMESLHKETQDAYKKDMREMQEAYRNCIKGEAVKERQIGELISRVQWLESLIPQMQAGNVDAAANQAANLVAKSVKDVVGAATNKVEVVAAKVTKQLGAEMNKAVDKAVEKRIEGNSER